MPSSLPERDVPVKELFTRLKVKAEHPFVVFENLGNLTSFGYALTYGFRKHKEGLSLSWNAA